MKSNCTPPLVLSLMSKSLPRIHLILMRSGSWIRSKKLIQIQVMNISDQIWLTFCPLYNFADPPSESKNVTDPGLNYHLPVLQVKKLVCMSLEKSRPLYATSSGKNTVWSAALGLLVCSNHTVWPINFRNLIQRTS